MIPEVPRAMFQRQISIVCREDTIENKYTPEEVAEEFIIPEKLAGIIRTW